MSYLNRPTSKRRSGSPELMYLLVVLAAGCVTAWWASHQIGMDLSSINSMASMLGLTGTILADTTSHGLNIWVSMAVTLLCGILLGFINGLLVTSVGLPSLAVTIGTLTLYRGVAQIILPNSSLGGFPD